MRVTLDAPWLEADLGGDHDVLSWAVHRPGFVTARRILWRAVRDEDLTADFDVSDWLSGALAARDAGDAVTMLTSRDVARYVVTRAEAEGVTAEVLATVGLSNAEAVGTRLAGDARNHWGTINIAVRLSQPLTQPALIEALSIAAEARTAAVMDLQVSLPSGQATGTGTDCLCLAAPRGTAPLPYAGLHTAPGEAIGRAVREAVTRAGTDWLGEMGLR